MIKVGTVCTGIGAPEMGMIQKNIPHEIVYGCEIDKYAKASYLSFFEPKMMVNDMTKEEWIDKKFYVDLLVGGIPCQSFSLAGKRLGELDKRGLLIYDFYRIVKNQQPKVFIIENVKGLISDNKGITFKNWLWIFGRSVNQHEQMFPHPDSLEYNLHHTVLNSKDFGVPQNRERVFIVGIRKDLPNDFRFPVGFKLDKKLKDILEPVVDENYFLSQEFIKNLLHYNQRQIDNGRGFSAKFRDVDNVDIMDTIKVGGGGKDDLIMVLANNSKGYSEAKEGDSVNYKNPSSETRRGRVGDQIANTLETSMQQGVVLNKRIRRLTPLECWRLQGFPDLALIKASNVNSDTQLYKQAGNSMSTPVIGGIIENLVHILK